MSPPSSVPAPEALDPAAARRAGRLPERRRALFELVRAERRARAEAAGVDLLRAGKGAPLVLVNPLGGELFAYAHLVDHLTTSRPVLGLPADAALGRGAELTFERLAGRYVNRLRSAGIRPALLAGWSIGGVLAYEIARQASAGDAPCPVLLVDSALTPPEYLGARRPLAMLVRDFTEDFTRSAGLPTPEPDDWSDADTVLGGLAAEAGLSAADLLGRYRMHADAMIALDDYAPESAVMPVHMIRATRTPEHIAVRWGDLVPGGPPTAAVDADHHGLLRPPAVAAVARVLDRLCGVDRGAR